jgi:hypothetical protein
MTRTHDPAVNRQTGTSHRSAGTCVLLAGLGSTRCDRRRAPPRRPSRHTPNRRRSLGLQIDPAGPVATSQSARTPRGKPLRSHTPPAGRSIATAPEDASRQKKSRTQRDRPTLVGARRAPHDRNDAPRASSQGPTLRHSYRTPNVLAQPSHRHRCASSRKRRTSSSVSTAV